MRLLIQSRSGKLSTQQEDYVTRRLHFALDRFDARVQQVRVLLSDLNGPRGGLDKRCVMQARLAPTGHVVVEVTDAEMEPAVSRAADRVARRVGTLIERRRTRRRRTAAVEYGGLDEALPSDSLNPDNGN